MNIPNVPETPIRAWQIWNEQNSPAQYLPKPDVASYERLLSVAYEKIHSIDPDAEVVLGGMFGTPLGGRGAGDHRPRLPNELYKIEGDDPKFDAVARPPLRRADGEGDRAGPGTARCGHRQR